MIGYLQPAAPGPAERLLHRSYQCGLCHTLGAEYGFHYRVFASADLVFFNVFADLVAGRDPGVGRRGCVLNPAGRYVGRLPARDRTDHARFTAAFGVYMGVEKLRDDYEDEGGLHRWLLWRLMRPGWRKARAALASFDFPVGEVESLMAEQSAVERGGALPLEDAAGPTRAIARRLFAWPALAGEARERAAAIGERVGGFLFYMDNLLDFHRDLRDGGYNALARAHRVASEPAIMPEGTRRAGLDGARAQVDALEGLLAALPGGSRAAFVRKALSDGCRQKRRRLEALPPEARRRLKLRHLRPPRADTAGDRLTLALRVVAAFAVLVFAPKNAWAVQALTLAVGAAAADTGSTPSEYPRDATCGEIFYQVCCCGWLCDSLSCGDCGGGSPDCGGSC